MEKVYYIIFIIKICYLWLDFKLILITLFLLPTVFYLFLLEKNNIYY